ncbi:ArsC/Spx/MgsR family protein [Pseudomonas sp. XS1P51]
MSCIVFYEKPGCATNRLQKELLRSKGLELEVRNLLDEPWTRESLLPFFGTRPVVEWFNSSAPAIKYGELGPLQQTAEQALALMLERPLLIRRPLIRFGEQFMVGFDLVALNALLPCNGNLSTLPTAIDSCSRGQHSHQGCQPMADAS